MISERQHIIDIFLNMKLRDVDRAAHENEQLKQAVLDQILFFPAFVMPSQNNPVAICGFLHFQGVGTVWMLATDALQKSAHHVLPLLRQICATMYTALNLHRMDVEVRSDFTAGKKWAEKVGFEFEGVRARGGYDGRDLCIYVWPDGREEYNGLC
jgi:RimJ/RimL family protein N-acetyltransferase